MSVREEPVLTEIIPEARAFAPASGSAYVFGRSPEDRSGHYEAWRAKAIDIELIEAVESGEVEVKVRRDGSSEAHSLMLRSAEQLAAFWRKLNRGKAYLDITGLSHNVWAPLLKSALEVGVELMVVYVEPGGYKFSATPTEGEIFDLSERIRGIRPIPGFASLGPPADQGFVFVPLLGFEGTRLAHVLEQVQPQGDKVVPVIGVPGFRAEFPFFTYHGNRSVLSVTRAWRNSRFAAANCPFGLFYLLRDIAHEFPTDSLKIAPIGTKPHGLGAILFALVDRGPVELIYDHPIRKAQRTSGSARLLIYHVSAFAFKRP